MKQINIWQITSKKTSVRLKFMSAPFEKYDEELYFSTDFDGTDKMIGYSKMGIFGNAGISNFWKIRHLRNT